MRFRGTRLLLAVLTLACAPAFAQKGGPLSSEKVLWLGDSITQAGDYVTLAEYYLNRQYASGHFDFVSVGLAWQVAFFVIAQDPVRFRPIMIPAVIEKFGYGASLLVLFLEQRLHPSDLVFAGVDLLFGVLFLAAFFRTHKS